MERPASPGDSLPRDLWRSLQVWRTDPALPVIELVLWGAWVLSAISGLLSILTLPALAFSAGWVGTARIWYLRRFRGAGIERHEIWRFTWWFVPSYVILGLLVGAVALLAWLPIVAALHGHPRELVLASTPIFLMVDFALTFVTPALAFSTRRVRQAIRTGLAMIRDEWPSSAAYVFIPPLAITVVLRTLPFTAGGKGWSIAFGPVAALANLAFRGATAAFYLRRHEVGPDGAIGGSPPDRTQAQP